MKHCPPVLIPSLVTVIALFSVRVVSAQIQTPAVIASVEDSTTGELDIDLSRALELSVMLHLGSDTNWIIDNGEVSDDGSNRVSIRITGSREANTSRRYEIRLTHGATASTSELTAPSDTSLSVLADAILLKCLFLLETSEQLSSERDRPVEVQSETVVTEERDVPTPAISEEEEDPPWLFRQRINPRRHSLAAGFIWAFGLDEASDIGGFEFSATIRLWRELALRLAFGGQFMSAWERSALSFWILPIRIALGYERTFSRRWTIGGFVGYLFEISWVDVNPRSESTRAFIAMGLGLEVRVSVALHDRVAIGAAIQAAWHFNDFETYFTDSESGERGIFKYPNWEISPCIEVVIRL